MDNHCAARLSVAGCVAVLAHCAVRSCVRLETSACNAPSTHREDTTPLQTPRTAINTPHNAHTAQEAHRQDNRARSGKGTDMQYCIRSQASGHHTSTATHVSAVRGSSTNVSENKSRELAFRVYRDFVLCLVCCWSCGGMAVTIGGGMGGGGLNGRVMVGTDKSIRPDGTTDAMGPDGIAFGPAQICCPSRHCGGQL